MKDLFKPKATNDSANELYVIHIDTPKNNSVRFC